MEEQLGCQEGQLEGRKRLIISTSNAFMAEAAQLPLTPTPPVPPPNPPLGAARYSEESLLGKRLKREEESTDFPYTAPPSVSTPTSTTSLPTHPINFRALREPPSASAPVPTSAPSSAVHGRPTALPPSASSQSPQSPFMSDEVGLTDKVLDLGSNKLVDSQCLQREGAGAREGVLRGRGGRGSGGRARRASH